MLNRRAMLLAVPAFIAAPLTAALSFELYQKDAFEAALKGSNPVIVHLHADW